MSQLSFNFVHHCISKFVQTPVDFFLNSLRTKLFICSTSYPDLIQNSPAIKKGVVQKGHSEKKSEIQGGGQEMAVMVG